MRCLHYWETFFLRDAPCVWQKENRPWGFLNLTKNSYVGEVGGNLADDLSQLTTLRNGGRSN